MFATPFASPLHGHGILCMIFERKQQQIFQQQQLMKQHMLEQGGGRRGQEGLRQEPGPLPLCPADQEQAGEGEEGHEALWILAQARAGHAKTELKMN